MDISVIVVTYNQEDTIGRTLDSILAQEFRGEYEIVIGDDCSSDGTRRVCEEYRDRYPDKIRYIRREKNLGVVGNYFDCIEQSHGRYLADCAGDDFWVDTLKLEKEYRILEANPEVTMVTTDWLACDIDGSRPHRAPQQPEVRKMRVYEKGELCVPLLAQQVMPHLCTALYRREPIGRILATRPDLMVDPQYGCEDLQIMLAASLAGKVVTIPGVTLHYSVGHDSISGHARLARYVGYRIASLRQTFMLCDGFGISDPLIDKNIEERYTHLFRVICRIGAKKEGAQLKRLLNAHGIRPNFRSRLYFFASNFFAMAAGIASLCTPTPKVFSRKKGIDT